MTAIIQLTLVNPETARLFSRTLKNGHLFFERLQVKIGLLVKESLNHKAFALIHLYQLHEELLHLQARFDDEIDKFEAQLEKRKSLSAKAIEFKARFTQRFPVLNGFSIALAELLEVFDKLLSTLKRLHLLGLFESRHTLYTLKERHQRELNCFLSKLLQAPSYKEYSITIEDAIRLKEDAESHLDYSLLKAALDSPFAPAFSPPVLAKLMSALNQRVKPNLAKEFKCTEVQSV